MMLVYTELTGHEQYCGSRTEQCVACGRYIMLSDSETHQLTNCEYPAVEQKNKTDSSAAEAGLDDAFADRVDDFFGCGVMHRDLPEHFREMLRSHRCDMPHLEHIFGRTGFHGGRSGTENTFFRDRFQQFSGDLPPPYSHVIGNADEPRANNGLVITEERGTSADHITVSSDDDNSYDDDGKTAVLKIIF